MISSADRDETDLMAVRGPAPLATSFLRTGSPRCAGRSRPSSAPRRVRAGRRRRRPGRSWSCRACPRTGSTCAGRCRSAARSAGPGGPGPCRPRGRRRPGPGAPIRALAEPSSTSWRLPPASTTISQRRWPPTSPFWLSRGAAHLCPARSSRGPGSGSARWPPARTSKISLAASLVPSKTVSVTWSRGSSRRLEPACAVLDHRALEQLEPDARERRTLSLWPKPCGVLNALARRGQALDHQPGAS